MTMFCSTTEEFILSPLSSLLTETVDAMAAAEDGMRGYQIADWVMPTVFLRMTGAQEQKLKCIYWDLGSVDLDQRYQRYSSKMGEMLCYDEKNKVCKELLSFIVRNAQDFDPNIAINRQGFLDAAKVDVERICEGSVVKVWYAVEYKSFEEEMAAFKAEELMGWDGGKNKCNELFKGGLFSAFDALYHHRNRCAHNSTSYQKNLPKFEALSGPYAKYENYFIRFFLLILLDRVFVYLYKTAVKLVDMD